MKQSNNIYPITIMVITLALIVAFVIYVLRKAKNEDKKNDNLRDIITYDPQSGKATIFDQWQYRNDSVAGGSSSDMSGLMSIFTQNEN